MAGSLSSTNNPSEEYDVFLSFRGEDTRNGFTSHLYAALCRKKICTFIDDQIVRGDEISSFLLNTIKASKMSVIIFSKNYASSRWCLQELEQILHCMKTEKQIVIPVFYHVDPSDVRNQTGSFGDGFVELEKHTKDKLEMLQRWKTALNEAASLAGWTINDKKSESKLIDETLDDILMRLNKLSPSDYTDLVGIEFAIKTIESLLHKGSNGVSIIGIWGIGGVGKTTIAYVVFNKILRDFEGSYFAENVREKSEESSGLTHLKKELLSTILEDRDLNIGLNFTRKRLRDKKVLIVFDDVTSLRQIENLIGNLNWLSSKSQIIITTRDKQVLRNCGVDDVCIYEVEGLGEEAGHILFNRYAFKQDSPPVYYMELSKKAVAYTKCLPMALKVLGSHFFFREKDFWESAIKKLEKCPLLDIHKILRVSYDGLDKEEKDIFLDIACFFKGKHIDYVTGILNACDLFAKQGVQVLIDKCLVSVKYNVIMMHDLLQQMGQEIVKRECLEEPGKRSRLWIEADIRHVLTESTGTKLVKGIMLNFSKEEIHCCAKTFSKMINLRLLKIRNVQLSEGLDYLSNKLRLLDWKGFPLKSLPPNLQLEKIFELKLDQSRIEQLQHGIEPFNNLESISFMECKYLIKTPDFTFAPNLKKVNLSKCKRLREIHPSLFVHKKITFFYMEGCTSLTTLPNQIHMESLEVLYISSCYKLEKFPEIVGSMDCPCSLVLVRTAIKVLPKSIELWRGLTGLVLCGSSKFDNFLEPLGQFKRLDHLYIPGCKGPSSNSLSPLSLIKILRLFTLSGICRSLQTFRVTDFNIEEEVIPNNIFDSFSSLRLLNLSKSNFVSLPGSIKHLSMLYDLNLNDCKRLQSLPELPSNIERIDLNGCVALETTSNVLRLCYSSVTYFSCINCSKLTYCNNLASSMPQEFLKAMSKLEEPFLNGFNMVIPGSEIPEWFQHQSETPSIEIERPPDSYDNKIVGYAGYCVFDVHEHQPTHSQDDYGPHIYFIHGRVANQTSTCPRIYVDRNLFKAVSDHLWLFYFPDLISNQDFVELSFASYCPGFAVKRCGIHPVYEKELKDLKPRTNKSSSSSFWNSCELDEDFLGSTVDVDYDGSEDEPISKTIASPNFINGEPSSSSSSCNETSSRPTNLEMNEFPQDLVQSKESTCCDDEQQSCGITTTRDRNSNSSGLLDLNKFREDVEPTMNVATIKQIGYCDDVLQYCGISSNCDGTSSRLTTLDLNEFSQDSIASKDNVATINERQPISCFCFINILVRKLKEFLFG